MPYYEVAEIAEIERVCRDSFKTPLAIKKILLSNVSTGNGSCVTIFEANRHTLYAFCVAAKPLVFRDVKRIITSMGIEPATYLPPLGDATYFQKYGRKAFFDIYPGRKNAPAAETAYYETLAPYSPALVRIAKIKGEIREYVPSIHEWQRTQLFSYAKVEVK